jgi:uncharacterized RDD family membrane protein YckC
VSIVPPPISADSLPVETPLRRSIGSLWRRVVAFAIDGMILFLVGTGIALPFFDTFSRLGSWGPLVGFCLALPYFAILDSAIGNGQTVGKRLMHIQVIDESGSTISLWRSAARYAVFAVPYFLNEMSLPVTRTPRAVSTIVSLIVFGIGGASLYLMVFNRNTRQGIHDLITESYVADSNQQGILKVEPIWGIHWVILCLFLVTLFISTRLLGDKLPQWGPYPRLLEDVRLVEGIRGVQAAGVQDLNTFSSGTVGKKKTLVINVYWAGKSIKGEPGAGHLSGKVAEGWADKEAFADQIAKLIIEHDSAVNEHDSLRVVIIRGYNLGIAHAQISYYYERTPSEWSTRLSGTSPGGEPPTKL